MNNLEVLHQKQLSSIIIFLTIISCLSSCEKEPEKKDFVAKVEKSILTKDVLNKRLSSYKYENFHEEEFIRNWIDAELLVNEAKEFNLNSDTIYLQLIEDIKRELIGSIVLKKYLEENSISVTNSQLQNYFFLNKENFRIQDDAFVLNIIKFDDYDKAILFRSTLLSSNWQKAKNVFLGDKSIITEETNKLYYNYQLKPVKLARIVNNLKASEFSIVLETELNSYLIVQLVAKLKKGTIPKLEDVYNLVENRYLITKKNKLIKNYIKSLHQKYKVEIKR